MTPMHVNQWRAIAATLHKDDVIEVEYITPEGIGTKTMRLTSEYRGWWRGKGTDGGTEWNYTTIWLGDQIYGGDPTVLLKYTRSNGQHGGVYGRVTDIRFTDNTVDPEFDFGGF